MDQAELFRYAHRLAEQRGKENEQRADQARKANKNSKQGKLPLWKQLTGRR
jgi:hypothetical protein